MLLPEPIITIGIADDHALVRKGIINIISSFGEFKVVVEAEDGEEMLNKVRTTQPDVCIVDINMPHKNGYQTVVELRKAYPLMKLLVLTMFDNEWAVLKMLRNGANGYLLKDCLPGDLKNALLAVHSKGFYHSDFVDGRLYKSVESDKKTLLKISDREMQFLALCCSEMHYKEMAETMYCSPRTVEAYRDSLFHKLNIHTRTALAMYAIQIGLVPFCRES